jgi:hypothetical protein
MASSWRKHQDLQRGATICTVLQQPHSCADAANNINTLLLTQKWGQIELFDIAAATLESFHDMMSHHQCTPPTAQALPPYTL